MAVSAVDSAYILEESQQQAQALGFDLVAITKARLDQQHHHNLDEFIKQGRHGEMDWLAARAFERASPEHLWGEARSILMFGVNYGPESNPLARLSDPLLANISCYALHQDYHDVIKKQLRQFTSWFGHRYQAQVKLFVDTAPVMEKPLAAAAGLGWQGKHTNLVSKQYGSWLFLGAMMTSLDGLDSAGSPDTKTDQPSNQPHPDHCGSCTACIDICPTAAITAPYQLDARRCISYLTIEHKGEIPLEYRRAIGNRVYGCDDCLAICPWNKYAKRSNWQALQAKESLAQLSLKAMLALDDAEFRQLFRKNPVKRIGHTRFMRNCLIAAGNSGDKMLIPEITKFLNHQDPILASAACWAFDEITVLNA
ncbi:MAG: tRNA epoxyqueuosine(34) reductase QueG [Alphaproteobacteria bacterium]